MNPVMPPPAWGLPAAAFAGALAGWAVALAVGRLVEPRSPPRGGHPLGSLVAVVSWSAVAAALWWWEVAVGGQLPPATRDVGVPFVTLAWRWAGHIVLLAFLAAATWVDLRDRVIPDAITVPGVLTGLAWAGLRPDSLPPVVHGLPRSFATPLLEADVLGFYGPLGGAAVPALLGAAPVVTGLGIAMALFLAWWLGCTAPPLADASGRRPFDLRLPMLAAGLAGIAAAWWHGSDHWLALVSALVGMAVGMAVVWATRIGASRALGREALGFGDVTLMAVIGAWLGWQGALLACCIGVLVGLVHGLVQFALARDNELAFGPSLCAGAVLVVVFWRPLWAGVGPAFERPLEVAAVAGAVIVLTALTLAAWWRLRGRLAG